MEILRLLVDVADEREHFLLAPFHLAGKCGIQYLTGTFLEPVQLGRRAGLKYIKRILLILVVQELRDTVHIVRVDTHVSVQRMSASFSYNRHSSTIYCLFIVYGENNSLSKR